MAEIITIPDLENGKVDIDTLADIVNLQESTTETRLSGPVNTWFGLQSQLSSATGLVYTTKALMDAAPGTKEGQAARVTGDTTSANNGLYIWSGSAWVKTTDPAAKYDQEIGMLERDTSNIFVDASISDLSLYGGDAAGISATTAAVPNKNIVSTAVANMTQQILTPHSPVEAGGTYYMLARVGRQGGTDNVNPDIDVFAVWKTGVNGGGSTVSETLLGNHFGTGYADIEKQVIAPATARSVGFRVHRKNANGNIAIGLSTTIIRRVADTVSMLGKDLLPAQVFTPLRAADSVFGLTDSTTSGVDASRPVLTEFSVYSSSTGDSLIFSKLTGEIALRKLYNLSNAGGQDEFMLDVKFGYSNRAASVGVVSSLEIGAMWYNAAKEKVGETVFESRTSLSGGSTARHYTVGTINSGAQYPCPTGAFYFSPFVRYVQTGPAFLLNNLDVTPHIVAESPDVDIDLSEIDRQLETKATLNGLISAGVQNLTAAQAAALTPFQRFMHEWYAIDGVLTHRDNLPIFAAQPVAITQNFPGGDYDTGTVNGAGTAVTLRAKRVGGVSGHIAAKLTGMSGKTPVITITNTDDWPEPSTLGRWRMVWGENLDSDIWNDFDNLTYNEGAQTWVGSNNKPFSSDTIYITRMPLYSYGRYDNKIRHWISTGLVSPTESAIDGFRIGTIAGRTASNGKIIPSVDAYALKIGTGPHKFVITSGLHPDEMPGHFEFEGAIDALLSSELAPLRDLFTFYVYPRINAQGLYGGFYRRDPQTDKDMNRIWNDGETQSDVVDLYMAAIATDVGSSFDGVMDFHSAPGPDPSTLGEQMRSIWRDSAYAAGTATAPYLEALSAKAPLRIGNSAGGFSLSTYLRSFNSAKLVVTIEYYHRPDHGVKQWKQYGVDVMRSLLETKDQF